ncbi:MAG TPA: hypothetical protein VIP11_20365 [Gemmatimonadaceae bacterium]
MAMWTRYSGLDPEVNASGQEGNEQRESFTSPLVRTLSLRLDLKW